MRNSEQEIQRRHEAVINHIVQHGFICPGWRRPPHPAKKLTADHRIAISAGGSEFGELVVLCIKCNSSRQGHDYDDANSLRSFDGAKVASPTLGELCD
jgi:5-methylcytosine-specific restriction endonuclease McrA